MFQKFFVRLSKSEAQDIAAALAAYQQQAALEGTRVAEGETDRFKLDAERVVRLGTLRGRIVTKLRKL